MSTASLEGARDHARAKPAPGADRADHPGVDADDLPPGVAAADVRWDETVARAATPRTSSPAGCVLRIADHEGDACVHLVVYNAAQTAERLNVADTVKVQWQAYLGPGALLLSDMGRVLMTIVSDTSARHDALCGARAHPWRRPLRHERHPLRRRRGPASCSASRRRSTGWRRDLPPGVNLFKSALVADDGTLRFDGAPRPGAAVELRAEMDVVVLIANVPHPLDERPTTRRTCG